MDELHNQPDKLLDRIPTRSRRQALDWSLVLVSQGIEPVIEPPANGQGWGLAVPRQDYGRAVRALRQYVAETKGWRWRQPIMTTGLLFDWASLGWAILLLFFFWLQQKVDLSSTGLLVGEQVARGQWWRLLTAVWLHADVAHLATNAVFGVLFLGLAMGNLGTGPALLAAYLAGGVGNLFSWLLATDPRPSLGASGMVMGAVGLIAVQTFSAWRSHTPRLKYLLRGLAAGLMLFILLGLSPGTNILAHFGGFMGGLLFGAILTFTPLKRRPSKSELWLGLLFMALILLPWWLALRNQG